MKRKTLIVMLLCMLMVFLCACGGSGSVDSSNMNDDNAAEGSAYAEQNTDYDIAGRWVIVPDKTYEMNPDIDYDLQFIFGTGFNEGNELVLKDDRTAFWYVGVGYGGEGQYSWDGSIGYIAYADCITENDCSVDFSVVEEDGASYIVFDMADFFTDEKLLNYRLCWGRAEL